MKETTRVFVIGLLCALCALVAAALIVFLLDHGRTNNTEATTYLQVGLGAGFATLVLERLVYTVYRIHARARGLREMGQALGFFFAGIGVLVLLGVIERDLSILGILAVPLSVFAASLSFRLESLYPWFRKEEALEDLERFKKDKEKSA